LTNYNNYPITNNINNKGYFMKLEGEPTLGQIDDYNGTATPEKKRLVRNIIIGLLVVGAIYGMVKFNFSTPSDYVGTPEKPGINTARE
jgi:hypothetical protein